MINRSDTAPPTSCSATCEGYAHAIPMAKGTLCRRHCSHTLRQNCPAEGFVPVQGLLITIRMMLGAVEVGFEKTIVLPLVLVKFSGIVREPVQADGKPPPELTPAPLSVIVAFRLPPIVIAYVMTMLYAPVAGTVMLENVRVPAGAPTGRGASQAPTSTTDPPHTPSWRCQLWYEWVSIADSVNENGGGGGGLVVVFGASGADEAGVVPAGAPGLVVVSADGEPPADAGWISSPPEVA